VDVMLGGQLTGGLNWFIAAENLFNEDVEARKYTDGIIVLASPRTIRAGLRVIM